MPASVINSARTPPYKTAGAMLLVVIAAVTIAVYLQFRGDFTPKVRLTMIAARAGLVMDPDSKVTYNGIEIGRIATVEQINSGGVPKARIILGVNPKYVNVIPANVNAQITATTVFGNKYVALTSPKYPVKQRISSRDVIDVSSVSTEFNTLFETVVSIAEKVDPVKLNQTLTAAAQALDGLGAKFGQSIANANDILDDLNPRLPQLRYDTQKLADLADVYADASPDLWSGLQNAVITARTLNERQGNLDSALMAAIGFAGAADTFERGGPYLVRGAADLIPTSALLDEYSPEIFCTIRKYHDVGPKVWNVLGGNNGYSLKSAGTTVGAGNPYVYPDNLPRINAHGGPEGRPGCWQTVTHDLWPAPYLVMDTGYTMAPYNHFGLGQPMFTEYLWGRQVGENTINP